VKIKRFVRQRLFSFCFSFSFILAVSGGVPPLVNAAPLPDIEAHQFQSTPVRMSKSGRVYLFQTPSNDLPKTGNLVLIHDHNKPAMAFRVLKTDPEKNEYVGKRVRRYDQTGQLKLDDKYFSIEKVADLLAEPAPDLAPAPTPFATPFPSVTPVPAAPAVSETNDIDSELDGTPADEPAQPSASPGRKKKKPETDLEVYDYDDDLDSSTSPRNLKKENPNAVVSEDEDDSLTAFEIDETMRLDPLKNMLSVSTGFFKNMSNFKFAGGTHNGFAVSYTRTLTNDVFVVSKAPQDSTAIEFGLGYYSRINMDGNNDVYKVVPMYAELHYNLVFSQTFASYLYLGIEYNGILSTENVNAATRPADAVTISNIQGVQQTFGAGFLYNMGPQWYLRLNLGWDRITAGLALKW
jgi:hypothetical protein